MCENVNDETKTVDQEISQTLVEEFLDDNAIEVLHSEENSLYEVSDENRIS